MGRTREVELGSEFTISLPAGHGWETPKLKGTAVGYLYQRHEESNDVDLFRFHAEHEGEVSIVVPARPITGSDQDFFMLVRVLGSGAGTVEPQRDRNRWLEGERSRDR